MPETESHSFSHRVSVLVYLGGQSNRLKMPWKEVEIIMLTFIGLVSIDREIRPIPIRLCWIGRR